MTTLRGATQFHIDGLEELKTMFGDVLPNEARNILRNTVNGIAARVRDQLRQNVAKDRGNLRKSIKVVRRRGRPDYPVSDVRGGSTAPYMLMLEFGTKKTRAQPFIVPTVESLRGSMPEIYREEFGKKLEKAAARRAKKAAHQ